MDPNILALINVVVLLTFVSLLTLAIGRIAYRFISYKREGVKVPLLLGRDFFFLSGLAFPFLGVLIFRAFGIMASTESWYPLWLIGSSVFALAGTAYWVYIEYFKIEK